MSSQISFNFSTFSFPNYSTNFPLIYPFPKIFTDLPIIPQFQFQPSFVPFESPKITQEPTPQSQPTPAINSIQCERCQKMFSTNGNLKNHILAIHENNRPFHCSFKGCEKSYSNKSRLIVHERTHTGIRPFICQICYKTFNEKGNLKTHLGFHLNQRPFICYECNKSYKTNGHLKDHIEIHHLQIKKYVCSICNCHFGRSSTLKSHMKTHTGERNFKCLIDECTKNFSEKGNMMKHYLRHLKKMGKNYISEKGSTTLEESLEKKENLKSAFVNIENNNGKKVGCDTNDFEKLKKTDNILNESSINTIDKEVSNNCKDSTIVL